MLFQQDTIFFNYYSTIALNERKLCASKFVHHQFSIDALTIRNLRVSCNNLKNEFYTNNRKFKTRKKNERAAAAAIKCMHRHRHTTHINA